jgi:hypothetical protein
MISDYMPELIRVLKAEDILRRQPQRMIPQIEDNRTQTPPPELLSLSPCELLQSLRHELSLQSESPYISGFATRQLPPPEWYAIEREASHLIQVHEEDDHHFDDYTMPHTEMYGSISQIMEKPVEERTPKEREYWFLLQAAFTARVRPPRPFNRLTVEQHLSERYRIAEALHCAISWSVAMYESLTGQPYAR